MNHRVRGMSLLELMLALLLGTLVVASAIGIFLANRKTMATSQGLGQMQQNMQVAFELLGRELRQAGANPCSRHLPLRNTLRGLTMAEFAAGTSAGARVAGSDAIEVLSADTKTATVVAHDGTRFSLNTSAHGFFSGNLLLVCGPRQASLFQGTVSGANITHPAGGMNCSGDLGLPGGCNAQPFIYAPHARRDFALSDETGWKRTRRDPAGNDRRYHCVGVWLFIGGCIGVCAVACGPRELGGGHWSEN